MMDEFYKGAELGLKVSDQRARHTNLAERASQTNRGLDIREKQMNADLSRLNLLNRKLDYEITQQENDDNEQTLQLDLLKGYKDQLAVTANDTTNFPELPMPPAGLHGAYSTDAIKSRENYIASRTESIEYKRHDAARKDEADLIDNFGLSADYKAAEPAAQQMMLQSARENRANDTAARISREMGVDPFAAQAKGINPSQYINFNGKLDENNFRAAIQPMSTHVLTNVTQHSSGATAKSYTTKSAISRKANTYTVQAALARGAKVKDEARKRRQTLTDSDDEYTPEKIDEIIRSEYPPDGVKRDANGNIVDVMYIGDKKINANREVVVFTGGDPSLSSSWKKIQ